MLYMNNEWFIDSGAIEYMISCKQKLTHFIKTSSGVEEANINRTEITGNVRAVLELNKEKGEPQLMSYFFLN